MKKNEEKIKRQRHIELSKRKKNGQVQAMQDKEFDLRRQQLEVESKKQDNFMQVMVHQQQQMQKQMQDFSSHDGYAGETAKRFDASPCF